ncbi:MAG: hypothetical protein COB14_02470 [Alphaproteobacteria bacterium]|nr:MAG: hypothetical protein COB14_02470 [Alphaproteobacteria bacterium]
MSLCLNGCAVYQRSAIDYLPETAKFLIENDINRSGGTENDQNTISVTAMLSSILGDEKDMPEQLFDDVQSTLIAPIPQYKPIYVVQNEVLDVIDLTMDDRVLKNIKQYIQNHNNTQNCVEISIGPLEQAENTQIASLKAMAKASAIGKKLKEQFKAVSIKFNPLLPRGTIKIVIIGKKDA